MGKDGFVSNIPVREAPVVSRPAAAGAPAERDALCARPRIMGYTVPCAACGETLPAPGTQIGMRVWSERDLADTPFAYCPHCGAHNAVIAPESR